MLPKRIPDQGRSLRTQQHARDRLQIRYMQLYRIKNNVLSVRLLATCLLLLVWSWPAFAADGEITVSAVAKFTLGMLSSAAVHEAAHALVATATGTNTSWKFGNYNQPLAFTENANSDGKGVALHASGLAAQIVGSEVILDVKSINKNDAFVRGMMTWNVLNPILYSLDYWVFRFSNQQNGSSYQGDLQGIEHYSNRSTAQGFAIGFTALSAFQGYRFLKTQDWAPNWLKSATDNVNVQPLRSGGAMLICKWRF